MLDIKAKAEIKNVNVRTEVHGDENVPAIDIKMMLIGVPVEKISTLCPYMGNRFYDEHGQVVIGEVNPLFVYHKVDNVAVELDGRKITECDIKKKAKIQLLPNKIANVELTVQTEHHDDLVLHVMACLKEQVDVTIIERQADAIDEMDQGKN